jgi:type II secretion system protein C
MTDQQVGVKGHHANRRMWRRTLACIVIACIALIVIAPRGAHWWQRLGASQPPVQAPVNVAWWKQTRAKVLDGVAPPAPTGNDSSISRVPVSLILTGTLPGRTSHEGYAYIGVSAESPQTYAVGAILANGARLAEVHPDFVVLVKDEQSERLYVKGHRLWPLEAKASSNVLTVGGAPPAEPMIASSHEELTDYIRPAPIYEGPVLVGYQVYGAANSGVFFQLGLQPGDVITALNSVPLSDPESAISQLESLTEGDAMTATVQRQGQLITVPLDGAIITAARARENSATMTQVLPGPAR